MGCTICGRNACCQSLHSIEEQEEFETKTGRYAPDASEELEEISKEIVETRKSIYMIKQNVARIEGNIEALEAMSKMLGK